MVHTWHKTVICTVLALSLCACAKAPEPEGVVRRMAVEPGQTGISVCLYGFEETLIASGEGESFLQAWNAADANSAATTNYDTMDIVLLQEALSHETTVQVAAELAKSEKRFPQILFYSFDGALPPTEKLIAQRKTESYFDSGRALQNDSLLVLPNLQRRDCCLLLCAQEPPQKLQGAPAELAKLFGGAAKSFLAKVPLKDGSEILLTAEHVLIAYEVSTTPKGSPELTVWLEFPAAKITMQPKNSLISCKNEAEQSLQGIAEQLFAENDFAVLHGGRVKSQLCAQNESQDLSVRVRCRIDLLSGE